jgi:hypothetical protein
MTSIRLPFAVFSLIALLLSCTKEKNQQAQGDRLYKIINRDGDSGWHSIFKYDTGGKLSVIEDSNWQTHMGRTFIYYNDRKQISKGVYMRYYGSLNNLLSQWTDSFVYDNNDRIIKTMSLFPRSTISGYKTTKTFTYDGQGRVTTESSYYSGTLDLASLTTFTYDASNDVVQMEEIQYAFGSPGYTTNTIKIIYNSIHNPYKDLGVAGYLLFYERYLFLSKHAPSQIIYPDHIKDYSYKYYDNGLPKKIIYTSSGQYASSKPNTTEFFYQ